MSTLPYTDQELLRNCRQRYEAAAQHGGAEAIEACVSLVWASVHSPKKSDQNSGLDLLEALLQGGQGDERELLYLKAVALYRQKHNLEARRVLQCILEKYPNFRQAATLLDDVEKEVIKDGLIGAGVGVAIIGAISAIAISALKK